MRAIDGYEGSLTVRCALRLAPLVFVRPGELRHAEWKLVEDLWDSIAADHGALPITDDQRIELDRRLNAYAVDKIRGRPAADAVRDIRRRL
jgi:putative addiction module component (TIGR02574 family)